MPLPKLEALIALVVFLTPHSITTPHEVSAQTPKLIKPVSTIQEVKLPAIPAKLDTVAIAAPTPTSSGGCVSGYVSGDYYLDKIIAYESSGNSCATNYLGCFGLLQACPGSPLREACGGAPACQIAWFQANKTNGRSWYEVWQHELAYGWW
jgi:hypothetical protein